MFNFRLQRVLDLKEKREQDSAARLTVARSGEESARQKCTELEEARADGARGVERVQSARPTVGQLQNLRFVVERLDAHLESAYDDAQEAEHNVRRCLDEYTHAFRERKVLDRLRDRARETYIAVELQTDRRLMDAIALSGFNRNRASSGGEAA